MKIFSLTIMLAVFGFFNAVAQEEMPKITIIHAGTLLAVAGENTLSEQSIIIEDGKVTDVVASYLDEMGDAEVTVIDLSDKFVMAGMMDMHVHLASSGGNAADHALAGVKNGYVTLMAGFTTVRDLGATDDTIFKLRKAINDGDVIGPRIYSAGTIIGVGSRGNGVDCNGVESCRRTTRDMIIGGADWIKIYSSCSGTQPCAHKDGSPMFFDDEMEAITQVAKKYNIPVAAHSHPTASGIQVLNYGVKSIEHGTHLNTASMERMKKDHVYYIPTFSVMDRLDRLVNDPATDPARAKRMQGTLDNNPRQIMKAYEMGVPIAVGTDAGVAPHGKNYREVEKYVEIGILNNDALKMATVNTADLLGKSDMLGSIEKGKYADIIAVTGNPLVEITDIENIVFVMKEGRVYKD
ncbi:MAG: amidohydrolase family protein [Kordiimonadaceae bacterium]|jgi:imidazolonepropionase-like amidohydrolase|nr:amidohydrolase family protein [Kordiimonadaceae bacterium]MBT6032694.1 amidohydrolase family protein [Kordiimonadaceae bacterium]